MAKGYMIFVEGMEPPKKVHNSANSAWREMMRLAELNEGKEILVFQLFKRMMKSPGDKDAKSLGSHFPEDLKTNMVDKSQLIRGEDIRQSRKTKAA